VEFHKAVRELKSKTNVEDNLKFYFDCVKEKAFDYAQVNFAFELLTLADSKVDLEKSIHADVVKQFLELISKGDEVSFDALNALRTENRNHMESVTKAVDQFTMLEYVLNRIEHQYVMPKSLDFGYSDLDKTDELLKFLGNFEQDAQNMYIMQILEQLPVRMTKNRFYETVSDRLSIYKEGDVSSFKAMVDSVKSAAGLTEDQCAYSGELVQIFNDLSTADLKTLPKKDYDAFVNKLAVIGEALNQDMDFGSSIQQLLNHYVAVVLSGNTADLNEACKTIVDASMEAFNGNLEALADGYDACTSLEGKLEETERDLTDVMQVADEIAESFAGQFETFEKDFERLHQLSLLCSNSLFADIDGSDLKVDFKTVDQTLFDEVVLELNKAFAALFATVSKPFVRATMARVFSLLPPRFHSQEELETFIYESLAACTDEAEKIGCLEVIENIMDQA